MPSSSYPTRRLGRNGPVVSSIGLGTMGIGIFYGGQTDEESSMKTLSYAADRGVTFWDTSDFYGTSEATLGKWFAKTGRRSEIFLATKFGSIDYSDPLNRRLPSSKPTYIRRQIQNSLKALQTDYIDLYYQHRVDPEVPIEVVVETLAPYVENGTIRWIGLSECSLETLRRAKSVPGVGAKVIAAQMEFNPFELTIEKNGFAAAVEEYGMGLVCYSPLSRGLVSGQYTSPDDFEDGDIRKKLPRFSAENFPKNLEVVAKLKAIADKHDATSGQVALAWILASHPNCESYTLSYLAFLSSLTRTYRISCPHSRDTPDQ
ncbi:hypothetical protein HGRIS_006715 [Hohenbuehelia grisea]|uniref:NADP-dependent oxidoreductase domain-containing protein n=1 Tax=Hohenbuehelia grisea TaxID=104357 RepID=A0ABR3JA78_9AGAR